MKQLQTSKTLFSATIAVMLLLSSVAVHTAFALTVSPAKVEITGDPGTTLQGDIELFNEQDGARTFYASFENFEPAGDSGAPHFIGAQGDLATWFSTTPQVTLSSGERKKIPFSITIPKDAQPGGHFAAIFWGSQAPGARSGGEVSIGGKIGVLVLLRVSGDVLERGGLLDFGAKDSRRFFTMLPVALTYRISNSGGDRIVPAGDVQIKNMFQMTAATIPANKNQGSVLPGSTRKFDVVWDTDNITVQKQDASFFAMTAREWRDFHLGWYTAILHVGWGSENQTANATYSFFIVPWQLLICFFIVFFFVCFAGLLGLRRYNRFIIARAQAVARQGK